MAHVEPPVGTPDMLRTVTDAITAAHRENAAHSARVGDERLTRWLEAFEGEHRDLIADALTAAAEHPDTPDAARAILRSLIGPEHQTQVLIGAVAAYAVISQVVSAVLAPFSQDILDVVWTAQPTVPLSPAEAALGVLRGHLDESVGASEAAQSGINKSRFEAILANTGEPLGLTEMLLLYRRGQMDDATLERGIRQSRVRNEWIPYAKDLRFFPPPVGNVIAAAVQNHLSEAEAVKLTEQAGIAPDNYQWLYETHGRPPGAEMLLQLLHRGAITEDVVRQAIRESDIKDKYIDAIIAGGRHLMPERTVVSAIRQGVLTYDQGIQHLRELGFNADDAATLAKEASATKLASQKDLSLSMIRELYVDRLIVKSDAHAMVVKLGYDTHEADFILALADHVRTARFQNAAINRIHALYVAHRQTKQQASMSLDAIGVDPTGRDDMLKLWTDERAANVPRLTLAQLQGALRRDVLSFADFRKRVLEMGYAESDLLILYAEAFPPSSAPTKLP